MISCILQRRIARAERGSVVRVCAVLRSAILCQLGENHSAVATEQLESVNSTVPETTT